MIDTFCIRDQKGANHFGTCAGCGKDASEEPLMVRYYFHYSVIGKTNGITVCLCPKCGKEMYEKIGNRRLINEDV